jgi:hypothetical protein
MNGRTLSAGSQARPGSELLRARERFVGVTSRIATIAFHTMMLYTAMTRVRKNLYIVEVAEYGKQQQKSASFQDSAFCQLLELGLAKSVKSIDEGFVEMTPRQHKVRGAMLVTRAISLDREKESTVKVKETFELAADRFRPHKRNEKDLLEQCEKH